MENTNNFNLNIIINNAGITIYSFSVNRAAILNQNGTINRNNLRAIVTNKYSKWRT